MSQTISVLMATNIVQVIGTINGAQVDFILTAPQIWTAEAARAETGRYELIITAIDGNNNLYPYHIVEYFFQGWTPPIFNRNQWDIERDRELGFLNYQDLLRIEYNCKYLSDTLRGYGYLVYLNLKLDWNMEDLPYQSEMARIINNLSCIQNSFYRSATSPELPDNIVSWNYTKLNDIEKVLYDTKDLIELAIKSFRFSGCIISGGVHGGVDCI